jgi:hypothetical protein
MPSRILDRNNISRTDVASCGSNATESTIRGFIEPKWFTALIEFALDQLEPGDSIEQAARDIWQQERDALSPLAELCVIKRLALELRRVRLARARAMQLRLPGFEDIPARIARADGKGRRKLLLATYEDLRIYNETLIAKAKKDSKSIQIKALMVLMRRHRQYGITVGQVLELEGVRPQLPD